MTGLHVYKAVSAITAELGKTGVPKRHKNEVDGYEYRSIDDVLEILSPALAKHRLCIFPRVVRHEVQEWRGVAEVFARATVQVEFELVSPRDGSSHCVVAVAEALDTSDKATAKAMSAAFKTAVLQTFCIPVGPEEDQDRSSLRIRPDVCGPEPVQGWEAWVRDIVDIIESCASCEALERLQSRHRPDLLSLSRGRPELYDRIGSAFLTRKQTLGAEDIGKLGAARQHEHADA